MRLPDWQQRFTALVAEAFARPFAWGERDCCLWMADAALAVTGIDHAAAWRGTYRTERAALLILQALGGLRGVGARLGNPIRPLRASAGDVGLVRVERKPLGAVCAGTGWLVITEHGAITLPIDAAALAWKV